MISICAANEDKVSNISKVKICSLTYLVGTGQGTSVGLKITPRLKTGGQSYS